MQFFLLFLFLLSAPAWADEITHQLGNSGYAIRQAMQAGAASKSPALYWKAVSLQEEAKRKFKNENLSEAVSLSKQAEAQAKLAFKQSS